MLECFLMGNAYYLWILGCQMNEADGDRINQILAGLNWQRVDSEAVADLIIIVACSVKQAAISSIIGKAHEWQPKRRLAKLKLILTGCVLDSDLVELKKLFDVIILNTELEKLAEHIPLIDNSEARVMGEQSKIRALIPISHGCNNYCSYCVVPYTRGREESLSSAIIINECEQAIKSGVKEIVLLGQNVNSYFDKTANVNFPKLLKLVTEIKGDYWLRFMSSHPKDLSDELLAVMAEGYPVAPHLHLALQSGDNQILAKMNRRYTAEHFLSLAQKAREMMPDLALSTDIIVGFPGETDEQFEQTAKVVEVLKLDMAYISPYSVRAGTESAKLPDDVSVEVKKARLLKLDGILRKTALANNEQFIGQVVKVLVDGEKSGKLFGKTGGNKVVSFVGDKSLIGSFVKIKVNSVKPFSLVGEKV